MADNEFSFVFNEAVKRPDSWTFEAQTDSFSHEEGPTTICLVLLKCAMASSERPRCALTSSGGVSASH